MFTDPRPLTPEEAAYLDRYLQRDFRKNLFGGGVLVAIGLFLFLLPFLAGAGQPGLFVVVLLIASFVMVVGILPPLWARKRLRISRQAVTVTGPLRRRIIQSNGARDTTCYIGSIPVAIPATIEGFLEEGAESTIQGVPYTMGKIESLLARTAEGCIALVVNGESVAAGYPGKRMLEEKEFKQALVIALVAFGIYTAIVLGKLEDHTFGASLRSHLHLHIIAWLLIVVPAAMSIRAVLHNRKI